MDILRRAEKLAIEQELPRRETRSEQKAIVPWFCYKVRYIQNENQLMWYQQFIFSEDAS